MYSAHNIKQLQHAREQLIASAAGFRKIFADDNREESHSPHICPVDREMVSLIVAAFVSWFQETTPSEGNILSKVAVATDTRPTGAELAQSILTVLHTLAVETHFLGIAATPELLSYVAAIKHVGAAICVTASHNPIGHNGIKLAGSHGALLPPAAIKTVIERFDRLLGADSHSEQYRRQLAQRLNAQHAQATQALPQEQQGYKRDAQKHYWALSLRAVPPGMNLNNRCRIVADFNGGARSVSIDCAFLDHLGAVVMPLNDNPGVIVHDIVPEGRALDMCAAQLKRLHKANGETLFGYVCDNDGDRGNLVYLDPSTGEALGLSSQEVFALICLIECSWYFAHHETAIGPSTNQQSQPQSRRREKVIVVANGPTSHRVDHIATCYGVEIRRAEVGEANGVELGRQLVRQGHQVLFVGEGSNGGIVSPPSQVRDPLQTVIALLKMLYGSVGSVSSDANLFQLWCRKRGLAYIPNYGLHNILATLPRFTTTAVTAPQAVMKIAIKDQYRFKCAYEQLLQKQWPQQHPQLEQKFGIVDMKMRHWSGIEQWECPTKLLTREQAQGGSKVCFLDKHGKVVASMWMRMSGTEAVLRLLVDLEGDSQQDAQQLLAWHRTLAHQAWSD